ncbi:aldo/keto reductase [Bradyrhizobium liaoningense]
MGYQFLPKGVSRIGLGCGRMNAGADFELGKKLIETAIELGVTHFDTAPSYGFGLSERLIGEVIGDNPGVTVATKVGLTPPTWGYTRSWTRRLLRPLKRRDFSAPLPGANTLSRKPSRRVPIQVDALIASVDRSRKFLRRDVLDVFLLHEPSEEDLGNERLAEALEGLKQRAEIGAAGVGSGWLAGNRFYPGVVEQFRWQNTRESLESKPKLKIHHGLLRFYLAYLQAWLAGGGASEPLAARLGLDPRNRRTHAPALLTAALSLSRNDVFLISSNNPARLRAVVQEIDWNRAEDPTAAELMDARKLFEVISQTAAAPNAGKSAEQPLNATDS